MGKKNSKLKKEVIKELVNDTYCKLIGSNYSIRLPQIWSLKLPN